MYSPTCTRKGIDSEMGGQRCPFSGDDYLIVSFPKCSISTYFDINLHADRTIGRDIKIRNGIDRGIYVHPLATQR